MELLRRYFLKERLQYENTVKLKYNLCQKDGSMIFFFSFFVCLFVCFFLFRLLKFLFQYFNSIENLTDMKNSNKNNGIQQQ